MPKILVTEDNDLQRKALCNTLYAEGYDCIEAENGEDALEKIRQEGSFDLIILDERMPKISGLQCYHQIRADSAFDKIPVLFVTVYRKPELEALERENFIKLILKPYNYRELLETIASLIET